jgi:NhaP-type Na+/H+ or K+/H+ antiporter
VLLFSKSFVWFDISGKVVGVRGEYMKTSTGLLISMMVFTVAGLLQGLVCVRYINRMSDDRSKIIFYFAVLILYAVGAAFFYYRWIKERGKETGECTEKR